MGVVSRNISMMYEQGGPTPLKLVLTSGSGFEWKCNSVDVSIAHTCEIHFKVIARILKDCSLGKRRFEHTNFIFTFSLLYKENRTGARHLDVSQRS